MLQVQVILPNPKYQPTVQPTDPNSTPTPIGLFFKQEAQAFFKQTSSVWTNLPINMIDNNCMILISTQQPYDNKNLIVVVVGAKFFTTTHFNSGLEVAQNKTLDAQKSQ